MLLIVLCSACAGSRALNPFDPSAPTGIDHRIRIEVQNLNFNDATVFAMRGGQRIRVGRVTGKMDQAFPIDWNVAQPIGFEVDVVGGRSCRTGQVLVEPEGRVWVSIPSDMGYGVCRAGRR